MEQSSIGVRFSGCSSRSVCGGRGPDFIGTRQNKKPPLSRLRRTDRSSIQPSFLERGRDGSRPRHRDEFYRGMFMTTIHYRTADVEGLKVFYREAGQTDSPMLHPERIAAIISQNGNAYEEGLSQ